MDNLDQHLQPLNSPIAQNQGAVSAYDFDAENERNTVNLTKIKNFSFSAGTGGTLVLGGTANGNGLMKVYQSNGTQAVQIDNTGVTVYNQNSFAFYDTTVPGTVAYFGADGASNVAFLTNGPGIGFKVSAAGAEFNIGNANFNTTASGGTVTVDGNFFVTSGNSTLQGVNCSSINDSGTCIVNGLKVNSSTVTIGTAIKTAIVPTSQGYNALYCIESPEVWFVDFVKVKRSWKFWKKDYIISPLFLEVTEAPYHFMPTLRKDIVQVWGKRKGFSKTRFEQKTKQEFMRNETFWSTPRR